MSPTGRWRRSGKIINCLLLPDFYFVLEFYRFALRYPQGFSPQLPKFLLDVVFKIHLESAVVLVQIPYVFPVKPSLKAERVFASEVYVRHELYPVEDCPFHHVGKGAFYLGDFIEIRIRVFTDTPATFDA